MTNSAAVAQNAATPAPKQLKKNDFLLAITEQPMTRGAIVEALEEYKFLPSYLDYLIEHFVAQGKVVVGGTADLPTYARKGSKPAGTGANRTGYKVVVDDEGNFQMETASLINAGHLLQEGYSATEKRAIKAATSRIFANYQAQTKAIKALSTDAKADDTPEEGDI